MNNSFFFAKRYLFSKSNKNAVNIISGIAVLAVIVGAMALFIVLSGFAGLKEYALQYTNVFDSDLKVIPLAGKTITLTPEKWEKLQAIKGVDAISQIIEERVYLQYQEKNHLAYIKGVDHSYNRIVIVDSLMYYGDWFENGLNEVVVGFGLAHKFSMPPRDYSNPLELVVPKPGEGQINILDPSSAFNKKRVVASGIYSINEDLNSKYVFTEIDLARSLLGLKPELVSSLEFQLSRQSTEESIRAEISEILGHNILIKNRIQQNDALYKMLNSENLFIYLFVSLIAGIAVFNITGTIIMVILEKRNNIRTLFFMGLTLKDIRKIFFYNGMLMTFIGTLVGLFLGSIVILLQLWFGLVPITPTLPYPVEFKLLNLILVFATIMFLGAIASKMASLKVTDKLLS